MKENPTGKKRSVEQGLEAADENVKWIQENVETVTHFLLIMNRICLLMKCYSLVNSFHQSDTFRFWY